MGSRNLKEQSLKAKGNPRLWPVSVDYFDWPDHIKEEGIIWLVDGQFLFFSSVCSSILCCQLLLVLSFKIRFSSQLRGSEILHHVFFPLSGYLTYFSYLLKLFISSGGLHRIQHPRLLTTCIQGWEYSDYIRPLFSPRLTRSSFCNPVCLTVEISQGGLFALFSPHRIGDVYLFFYKWCGKQFWFSARVLMCMLERSWGEMKQSEKFFAPKLLECFISILYIIIRKSKELLLSCS